MSKISLPVTGLTKGQIAGLRKRALNAADAVDCCREASASVGLDTATAIDEFLDISRQVYEVAAQDMIITSGGGSTLWPMTLSVKGYGFSNPSIRTDYLGIWVEGWENVLNGKVVRTTAEVRGVIYDTREYNTLSASVMRKVMTSIFLSGRSYCELCVIEHLWQQKNKQIKVEVNKLVRHRLKTGEQHVNI